MHIFWEVRQQQRIGQAKAAANSAQSAATDAKSQVRQFQRQLDKSMMLIEALWTLCREAHGWTDQQLVDRVTDIDLRDGQLDGKVAHAARPCAECGRTIAADRDQCMWCGREEPRLFGQSLDQGDAPTPGPGGLAP